MLKRQTEIHQRRTATNQGTAEARQNESPSNHRDKADDLHKGGDHGNSSQ